MGHYKHSSNLIILNAAPDTQSRRGTWRFANAMGAFWLWLWAGYRQYASLTTVYDEYGKAHSTLMWF